MTKKELLEAIRHLPDDTEIGIAVDDFDLNMTDVKGVVYDNRWIHADCDEKAIMLHPSLLCPELIAEELYDNLLYLCDFTKQILEDSQ